MRAAAALLLASVCASSQGCNSPPPETEPQRRAPASSSGGTSSVLGWGGAQPVAQSFELLWQDDFDAFDESRWEKPAHSFEENAGYFRPDNAVVEDGLLKMRITAEPHSGKLYSAAEIRTSETFQWGRFEARFKPAAGSGLVSSLFTYLYQPWNEIDIEYLGHQRSGIQYNLITDGPSGREYQPYFDALSFMPHEDFHDYAFEWTPGEVRFFVDGVPMYVETRNVAERMNSPVKLHINCWPVDSDVTTFAGIFDPSALPAEAQYDWVRVYRYVE